MINQNQTELVLQRCILGNLTAPVRVLLLFEEERVAGDVGRCEEVDLVIILVMMMIMMVMVTLVSQHDDYGDGPGCFVMIMTIRNCNKCMVHKFH